MRLLLVFLILALSSPVFAFTARTPFIFNSSTVNQWIALGKKIEQTLDRQIILYVSGNGGGNYQGGNQLIDSIQRAQSQGKHITMIVNGRAGSMHANILCFANNVVQKAVIMFHAVSRKNGVMAVYPATDIEFYMRPCVNKGIMSETDLEMVKQGKDVLIFPNGKRVYLH